LHKLHTMKEDISMWQSAIIISDLHIPFHDKKAVEVTTAFIRDYQPDALIINGDLLDFWEVSSFDKDPRIGTSFKEELEMGRKYLKYLREILPNSKIKYLEGNHEFRLKKYIMKNAAELSGLEGLSVEEQLGLYGLNIEYIQLPPGLSRYDHNDLKIGDLYIGHYNIARKHAGYSAKALMENLGVSLIQAHTHKQGLSSKRLRDGRELIAIESGCLCNLEPNYVKFPNWQHGLVVAMFKKNSPRFQVYPIRIADYEFFYGGNHYDYQNLYKKDKDII
jgi:predicted phosphodiesterase